MEDVSPGFVELGDDLVAVVAANGINDDDGVTLARDFGRVSLSEHGPPRVATARHRETRVEIATDDLLEIVEKVRRKPDECIVLELLASRIVNARAAGQKSSVALSFGEKQSVAEMVVASGFSQTASEPKS